LLNPSIKRIVRNLFSTEKKENSYSSPEGVVKITFKLVVILKILLGRVRVLGLEAILYETKRLNNLDYLTLMRIMQLFVHVFDKNFLIYFIFYDFRISYVFLKTQFIL
jgi:hypothetical protein